MRMEWVASSLQLDSERSIQCYYNRSPPTRTPRKPADINGLVRFAGRPNLVSARVPSRSVFTRPKYAFVEHVLEACVKMTVVNNQRSYCHLFSFSLYSGLSQRHSNASHLSPSLSRCIRLSLRLSES